MKYEKHESSGDVLIYPGFGEIERDILVALVLARYEKAPYSWWLTRLVSRFWPEELSQQQAQELIVHREKGDDFVLYVEHAFFKMVKLYVYKDIMKGVTCYRLRSYPGGFPAAERLLKRAQEILNGEVAEKPLADRFGQEEVGHV